MQDTIDAGAERVLGGEVDGLVMHPVVLSDVTQEMRAAKEELFGPVAPILAVDGEEEAIRTANATPLGLSSAVFRRNGEQSIPVGKRIEAGMTHVNHHSANDEPNTAFGGEKKSGLGRFGGFWAVEELTRTTGSRCRRSHDLIRSDRQMRYCSPITA